MDERLSPSTPLFGHAPVKTQRSRVSAILGRDWKIALVFVLPIVIIMGGLIVWPFISAIMMSMTVRSLITRTETFVGLDNYARLLTDSDFIVTVKNTVVLKKA
jgi:multiple sugar transport system permease protein